MTPHRFLTVAAAVALAGAGVFGSPASAPAAAQAGPVAGAGAAVADRVSCTNAPERVPVLLVHGWRSSAQAWAGNLDRLGADPRSCVETFDYGQHSMEWVTNPHIGKALALRIAELAGRSPTGKIIVVGHSMGGLAVRCAASAACGGDATTASRLLEVIMLDTPNHGTWLKGYGASNLSNVLLPVITGSACHSVLGHFGPDACGYLSSVVTSPAAYAFTPGSKQLNALANLPKSVPVYTIAGSVVVTTSFFSLNEVAIGNAGDLVVSHESALAASRKAGGLGGKATVDCGTLDITMTTLAKGKICWHGGEPGDDQFATLTLQEISRALNTFSVSRADLLTAPVPALRGNPEGRLRAGKLPNPTGGGSVYLETRRGAAAALGDLTADGNGDAAAVINATSGAGGLDQFVELYTKEAGELVRLAEFDPASAVPEARSADIQEISISQGAIRLKWGTFANDEMTYWSASLTLHGGEVRVNELTQRTTSCPSVGFQANSGDGAFDVAATDTSCADATRLIRDAHSVGARPPTSVQVDGWDCEVSATMDEMAGAFYSCAKGLQIVTWVD